MKGVISLWGERYPCTVIEQGKIMVVTEDIGGRPCPEGTKRYFKENRGVWAECRKAGNRKMEPHGQCHPLLKPDKE